MNYTEDEAQDIDEPVASSSLVTVDSFLSPNDAYVARIQLEAEGIDAYLDNENLVSVNPMLGPATGGIKLRVPGEQAARASEILAARYVRICPACSSENVTKKPLPTTWFILSIVLLTIPFWLLQPTWVCHDCEENWR